MGIYEKMYYHLFNAVTDALEDLEERNYGWAEKVLKVAQQEGEEFYLEHCQQEENPLTDTAR